MGSCVNPRHFKLVNYDSLKICLDIQDRFEYRFQCRVAKTIDSCKKEDAI